MNQRAILSLIILILSWSSLVFCLNRSALVLKIWTLGMSAIFANVSTASLFTSATFSLSSSRLAWILAKLSAFLSSLLTRYSSRFISSAFFLSNSAVVTSAVEGGISLNVAAGYSTTGSAGTITGSTGATIVSIISASPPNSVNLRSSSKSCSSTLYILFK